MEGKPYRVIVWCAVSSKQQAQEDKASLPAQEAEGREFAETVGGAVVDVLVVPGHSRDIVLFGDAAQQIEAYQKLYDHCEAADFDVLWARDPDRLGRDPALAQTVASLVERSGAEVYVASAPHQLGQTTSGQRYVYAIQSVRAGEDQRRRVRYQRMGVRKRIERGLPLKWPHGYVPIRDHLTGRVVGAEFDEGVGAVRLATELFLRGEPYTEIAKALDASPHRPPVSDRWRGQTIWVWMNSPTYAGIAYWADFRADGPSPYFPAVWDRETYRAVLRELENRKQATYRKQSGSPFLGVAFCARCGARMVKTRNQAGTVWLRCGTHRKSSFTGTTCHANNIKMEAVGQAISAYLAQLVDLEAVNAQLADQADREPLRERLAEIERSVEAAEKKRNRLALAYAAGAMDMSIYRTADDQVLDDLAALAEEAERIEAELAREVDPAVRLAGIEIVRVMLEEELEDVPALEVSTVLRNIGLRVEIEDRRVVWVGMV